MKKNLRDIFPLMTEDMGVAAIGGGGAMGTGAIQNFDPVIAFRQPLRRMKKPKRINKTK